MTERDCMTWLTAELARTENIALRATQGCWTYRLNGDTEEYDIVITGPRTASGRGTMTTWVVSAGTCADGDPGGGGVYEESDAQHIVRWGPYEVLRQVAGARELLDIHGTMDTDGGWSCSMCIGYFAPCSTVKSLAKMWGWVDETIEQEMT